MKRKTKKPERPKMHRITDEMKQWSAMIGQELNRWPHVTTRPMFGLLGFYRKAKIFAALPVTRAIGTPNSIIFKIEPMPPELLRRATSDRRLDPERHGPGTRWRSFEIGSKEDLRDALWWLNQAYKRATGAKDAARSSRGGA
jgi:hypothetical protein